MYGKQITNQDIVSGNPKPPAGAAGLLAVLGKYQPTGK